MSVTALPATPRIRRLRSLTDCSREIAYVYGLSRKGEVSTQDMSRWTAALNTLAGLLRDERMLDDFAARLAALEGRNESKQA